MSKLISSLHGVNKNMYVKCFIKYLKKIDNCENNYFVRPFVPTGVKRVGDDGDENLVNLLH